MSLSCVLAAANPVPEIDYHGYNLDALSFLKPQALPAPLYTEPIYKNYPQPLYPQPLYPQSVLKESFGPIYAAAAPIVKAPVLAPTPIYASVLKAPIFAPAPVYEPAAPILKAAAPVYAPVYKAAVPVVKAVAPATSYASVTKYHISHAPVIKVGKVIILDLVQTGS